MSTLRCPLALWLRRRRRLPGEYILLQCPTNRLRCQLLFLPLLMLLQERLSRPCPKQRAWLPLLLSRRARRLSSALGAPSIFHRIIHRIRPLLLVIVYPVHSIM